MARHNATLYMPYGAYELKASYQRHLLLAMLITTLTVGAVLAGAWIARMLLQEETVGVKGILGGADRTVGGRAVITQTFRIRRGNDGVVIADQVIPRVGNLVPIPDSELVVGEMLMSNEQIGDMLGSGYGYGSEEGEGEGEGAGEWNVSIPLDDADDEPGVNDFVPHERAAVMVFQHQPEYPRLAQMAGIEGTVHVKALVGIDGNVRKAVAWVSSGHGALDEAAVAAAFKCKFSPALQNGSPVALWVVYQVVFVLGQ